MSTTTIRKFLPAGRLSKKILKASIIGAFFVSLSACSWVDPIPQSDLVKLAIITDVTQCEKVADIKTSVADHVGFVKRDSDQVVNELVILAKNEAVKLGGNTLVPASPVLKGEMHFWLYQCSGR